MKVTREWMNDFDYVVAYMDLTTSEIEECKQEVRDHPEWALEFYPKAAAQIRASRKAAAGDE